MGDSALYGVFNVDNWSVHVLEKTDEIDENNDFPVK